ncbi:MAG: hypothetical protein ACE5GL_00900 [Calditrichia bacterium]
MQKRFFLLLSFFLFTGGLFAQTYPVFPVGEYWNFPDARTMGLAGSGSISNPTGAAISLNPAALAKNRMKILGQFTAGTRKLEERRAYPIYSRIDDITQRGTYVVNNNWMPSFQGDIIVGLNTPYLKTIGFAVHEEINHNYLYEEEVRENIFGDSLLAFNRIEFNGVTRRYALGAGFDIGKGVLLGFQLGILQGGLDKDSTISFQQKGFTDVKYYSNRTLDNTPVVFTLGAIYDLNKRISLGSHLQLPYSLKYNFSDSILTGAGKETIEYPTQLTVGFEYRAQQVLEAKLNIDFTYEWWSKTNYSSDDPTSRFRNKTLDDALAIKVGIEHIFHNKIPFQLGYQFRTSYSNRSTISRSLITAGTGFRGRNWQVEAAGGFSGLDYRFGDLFDDTMYGGDRHLSPIDDVSENFFFGLVTLKINIQKK